MMSCVISVVHDSQTSSPCDVYISIHTTATKSPRDVSQKLEDQDRKHAKTAVMSVALLGLLCRYSYVVLCSVWLSCVESTKSCHNARADEMLKVSIYCAMPVQDGHPMFRMHTTDACACH